MTTWKARHDQLRGVVHIDAVDRGNRIPAFAAVLRLSFRQKHRQRVRLA